MPEKGFYTTVANVDHALEFLGEARAEKKPWFLYIAFNAPHAPLQPLEEDYKKYLGRYDAAGTRSARRASRSRNNSASCPRYRSVAAPGSHPRVGQSHRRSRTPWEAPRMAAYAGLIDRVDQEMGRLIADLEQRRRTRQHAHPLRLRQRRLSL